MTLYYDRAGNGPDVVLVHGWGLHGGVWTELAQHLAARCRVTLLDLPGHGRSRLAWPREFTPETLAEEIRQLLPGPAIWIGWSLGALVALAAAQQFSASVIKLVLIGATPKFVTAPDWPHATKPALLQQFAEELERDYAATLTRFLSLQLSTTEDRAILRYWRTELFRHGEPAVAALRAGLQLLQQEDWRLALPDIAVSTLVIHGGRDRLAPPAAGEFLAAHLPQAQLELLPSSGHAPFLSHPSAVSQKLEAFIHG